MKLLDWTRDKHYFKREYRIFVPLKEVSDSSENTCQIQEKQVSGSGESGLRFDEIRSQIGKNRSHGETEQVSGMTPSVRFRQEPSKEPSTTPTTEAVVVVGDEQIQNLNPPQVELTGEQITRAFSNPKNVSGGQREIARTIRVQLREQVESTLYDMQTAFEKNCDRRYSQFYTNEHLEDAVKAVIQCGGTVRYFLAFLITLQEEHAKMYTVREWTTDVDGERVRKPVWKDWIVAAFNKSADRFTDMIGELSDKVLDGFWENYYNTEASEKPLKFVQAKPFNVPWDAYLQKWHNDIRDDIRYVYQPEEKSVPQLTEKPQVQKKMKAWRVGDAGELVPLSS